MSIPGVALIDKILAGLPENSRLRTELAELRAQVASLARENEQLKAHLLSAQPPTGIDAESIKVLKVFFQRATDLTPEVVVRDAQMEKPMVDYHIGALIEKGLVKVGRVRLSLNTQVRQFVITQAGRELIVKHRMI